MNNLSLITDEISKVILGKKDVIKNTVLAIAAGGHILLEDIPGVGKTTLALALSRTLGLDYNRIQFTPDVMPSDVIGFNMYNQKTGNFEYVKGGAVCNLFLADEINRTSSKTQSALLELMEEGRYTVDGVTRKLPMPFIVIATQNPFGSAGTQRLPQSQIERFMIRTSIGYPDAQAEIDILKGSALDKQSLLHNIISAEELMEYRAAVENMYVKDNIYKYIVKLVNATRHNKYIEVGISPRGSIAILKMAKASALYNGREFVTPDDILDILECTACHRIEMSSEGKAGGITEKRIIEDIAASVKL